MPNYYEHLNSRNLIFVENSESYSSINQKGSLSEINKVTITEDMIAKVLNEAFRKKLIKFHSFQNTQIQTPGMCRICFQPDMDDLNKCLTPCFCRGSISKVHRICLQKWLAQSGTNECEICKFKYETKHSFLGSIKAWLFDKDTQDEVKELLLDGVLLCTIAPTITILTRVMGLNNNSENSFNTEIQINEPLISQVLERTARISVVLVDLILSLWTSNQIQHHLTRLADFYFRNHEMIIVVDPEIVENQIN